MKKYISEIINILNESINLKEKDKAFLFRLENFIHPQVYLDICRYFKIKSSNEGVNFNAKLGKEKYSSFNEHEEFSTFLEELEDEDYIEHDVQLTTWRNAVADQKGILFLMGSESVQDQGGLADFYKITPEVIEHQIGKDYAHWFRNLIEYDDLFEKNAINHFFEHLFRVIPKDLFKLSLIVDRIEDEKISGIEEVLGSIGRNLLIDWGLPSINGFNSKTINNLGKAKKFDLIEKANKFKNRAEFKDGLTKTKFNKLIKKLNDFNNDEEKVEEFAESILKAKELFGSYQEFEQSLINYFKGIDLDILRPKLFQLDFNFINEIVNFKLTKGPAKSKDKIIKVYGSPIEAFAKIIFNSISTLGEEIYEEKPKLEISVNEAVLSNYIEDNKYDLYNAWTKICFATGGLIEYLQEEFEGELDVYYKEVTDPFQISNVDNLSLKPSKGTQTLSNVMISVRIEGVEKPLEYKWIFSPNEYWLNSFDINLLDQLIEASNSPGGFLPVFYSSSLGNLLSSVDSDIFFYQLNSADQGFINVFDLLPKEIQEGKIASKLYQLSKPFQEFINDLKNKGLYNTVNSRHSQSALQFVDKYTKVIESILNQKSDITTIERKYIHLICNVFMIVHSKESAKEEFLKGAIVPPIHPAMLEKIIEQQSFYRQGLFSLVKETSHNLINRQYEKEIENIIRQSTIISGVDSIISDESNSRLTKEVYGYYALHGEILDETSLESIALLDGDLVFDEDFNTKDMLNNSFMSRLIEGKLTEYVQIFPGQSDCIRIGFVNFEHLQPVVAGVHTFIESLKTISHDINIRLQIISPSSLQEGRAYVSFWLDNFFHEDDNVKIETFYKNVNLESENSSVLDEVLLEHDMIFVNDVMSTSKIAYHHTGTRFPMVFHPIPIFYTDTVRRISISQRQFQAAFMHSQLTQWIENPDNKEGIYRVEKELYMSEKMKKVLELIHNKARWVVTLDAALDKKFFDSEKVISFSTGEGPYGELNMTISASNKVRKDVVNRLTKRLKDMFPTWDRDKLNNCAEHCIDQSRSLDGIKVLKALNPYDYEVHSFLSYILSVESLEVNSHNSDTLLKAYIPMDSYMHWFKNSSNRPDYLLIEIKKDSLNKSSLDINATVIECKMGKSNNVHVEKGIKQITNSLSYLSEIFNGSSTSFNKRYWYAQLFRALVFAPNYVPEIEQEQLRFNKSLLNILDGKFNINWSGKLLTYWLDYKQEEISKEMLTLEKDIQCTHEAYGQLYIQKHLLPQSTSENVEYIDLGEELLSFSNNRDEFEELVYENHDSLLEYLDDNNSSMNLQKYKLGSHRFKKVEKEINDDINKSSINLKTDLLESQNIKEKVISDQKNYKKLTKITVEDKDEFSCKDMRQDERDSNETEPKDLIPLEKIRVLLGKDIRSQENIYWEYGHPQLENRHILISGKSGVGKTYFIQCLLYELAKSGVSSIVFDYTDGFKKSKLEPDFNEALAENIEQFLVFKNKFPINPFKRNLKELDEDEFYPESDEDVADRIKSVFMSVYKDIGSQQANALYQATKEGLRKYGEEMDLKRLGDELESLGTSYATTTLSKLQSIIDRNPFDTQSSYNWEKHLQQKGKVFIVQLTGFNRDVQLVITEFILWDLWNYLLSKGDKSMPFPAIIDEAQNLDHSEKSPSAKILTEGRKFGWSGWYATQFMQGQLKKDEIQRLQNSSQKIYFSPPEEEITNIASYLDTEPYKRKEWAKKLSGLRKGQCIVWGPTLKSDGNLQRTIPKIVDVISLAERIRNDK